MELYANVLVVESLAFCIEGFAFHNSGAPRRTIPMPENVISSCYLYYSVRRLEERL